MKKYLLAFLIISTSFLVYEYSFADVVISPQKLYKEGVTAYENEDYRKATRLLEDATKKGLGSNELKGAYLLLYWSALKLNDASKANHWAERCNSIISGFAAKRDLYKSPEDIVANKIDKKYKKILLAYIYSFNYDYFEPVKNISRTDDGKALAEKKLGEFRQSQQEFHRVYGDLIDITVLKIADDQQGVKNIKEILLNIHCEKDNGKPFFTVMRILLKGNDCYLLF